jgi:hypothetical protein
MPSPGETMVTSRWGIGLVTLLLVPSLASAHGEIPMGPIFIDLAVVIALSLGWVVVRFGGWKVVAAFVGSALFAKWATVGTAELPGLSSAAFWFLWGVTTLGIVAVGHALPFLWRRRARRFGG